MHVPLPSCFSCCRQVMWEGPEFLRGREQTEARGPLTCELVCALATPLL